LFLLFLALRRHSRGERTVWTTPVTAVSWFPSRGYAMDEKKAKLPLPVTTPVGRSRSKGAGALDPLKQQKRAKPQDLGKIRTNDLTPPKSRQQSYEYKHGYWLPKSADAPPAPRPPPKAKDSHSHARTQSRRPSRERTREKKTDRPPHRHRSRHRDGSLTRGRRDGSSTRGRRDGSPTRGRRGGSPTRGRRDGSLTRGNSGNKKPSAGNPPPATLDLFYRDASPRR